MHQHYHHWLVLVSLLVAILASYTAITLALRIRVATRQLAPAWLIGGGVAMGIGIWSMHFVGMLALTLPIEIAYDVGTTLLSMVIAIVVSTFALHIASRKQVGRAALVSAGFAMGIGICAMHYVGMAAIEITPPIRYDPLLGRHLVRDSHRRVLCGPRRRVLLASAVRLASLSSCLRGHGHGTRHRRHALCRDGGGAVPGNGREWCGTGEQGLARGFRHHDHVVRARRDACCCHCSKRVPPRAPRNSRSLSPRSPRRAGRRTSFSRCSATSCAIRWPRSRMQFTCCSARGRTVRSGSSPRT